MAITKEREKEEQEEVTNKESPGIPEQTVFPLPSLLWLGSYLPLMRFFSPLHRLVSVAGKSVAVAVNKERNTRRTTEVVGHSSSKELLKMTSRLPDTFNCLSLGSVLWCISYVLLYFSLYDSFTGRHRTSTTDCDGLNEDDVSFYYLFSWRGKQKKRRIVFAEPEKLVTLFRRQTLSCAFNSSSIFFSLTLYSLEFASRVFVLGRISQKSLLWLLE